jgi:acyl CoA:acetate/3-ketoacid CoA transferase
VITEVGLDTFVDPKHGGGKANARANEDLVERVMFDGRPYLRYKPFHIDTGIVRASHDEQRQTHAGAYDPALSGEAARSEESEGDAPEGVRRIIAARATRELRPGASVNFGYGMPAAIVGLLNAEEKAALWGTIEQGGHNGDLIDGPLFGASRYPQAIVSSLDQFDFYSGGGVDIAFLGMGEMDAHGNVNVSRLGDSVVGPGGFMDITRKARKVVFCGTFEAKGLRVEQDGDGIAIRNPGSVPKLVPEVREITFSGAEARRATQEVLYVTERAVFALDEMGVTLIEVAGGIDRQRDVLDRMGFRPRIACA